MNFLLGKIEQLISHKPRIYTEEVTSLIHQSEVQYEKLLKKHNKALTLLGKVVVLVKLSGHNQLAKEIEEYIKENEKDN